LCRFEAKKLLKIGAIVIMVGRSLQKIEKVVNEFKASKVPIRMDHIHIKNMDFNEPSNVEKDFQNLMLSLKGKLDVVINAAGVVNRKSLKQATLVDWDKSMSLEIVKQISNERKCESNVPNCEYECAISQGFQRLCSKCLSLSRNNS
jgi:NADP-dependent 3-hydroxy acid dehydrogenase YdfG